MCQVSLCSLFSSLYLFHCAPPTLSFIQTSSPLVFWEKKEKAERGGRRRKSHQQCLRCGVSEASCYPGPLRPRLPSRRDRRPERGNADQEMGICVVGEEEVGSASLLCSAVRGSRPTSFTPPLQKIKGRRPSATQRNKNVNAGRDYGDCVAGLLWAELGERLGLQLPGGAPPGRPPVAPLSRPSEFSSISWMRGGMEPGISIFSVMTRSAPARRRWREREMQV